MTTGVDLPPPGSPEYAETAPILLAKFQDHKTWARHHEDHRARLTNIFVLTAGAVLSLAGKDAIGGRVPVGVFLLMLGGLGALMCRKHVERFGYHSTWARHFDQKLRLLAPYTDVVDAEALEEIYRKKTGRIADVSLNWLWISVHLGIALIGLFLLLKPLGGLIAYFWS